MNGTNDIFFQEILCHDPSLKDTLLCLQTKWITVMKLEIFRLKQGREISEVRVYQKYSNFHQMSPKGDQSLNVSAINVK